MIRNLSALLCIVLFSVLSLGQDRVEVTILDSQTKEPLAFVKVGDGRTEPILSDIDGKVTLTVLPERTYRFSFFDYLDTNFTGQQILEEPLVYLAPDLQLMDEVIITPGENPAHRIMRNVIDKRKENDPLRNNSFKYDSYTKFTLTGELNKPLDRDTLTDSSLIRMLNTFDRQYLFLTETAATRTFIPPNYDKELVTSYNVSGVKDPLFATLANQFQSFSFYDNVFSINDREYINPIAPGGIRRYLFILEDTLVHSNNDTTFTIKFRPRKGKNFEGMQGFLYIHTNNWAIEKVIASPYEESGIFDIKVIHSYRFTNELKWFPYEISTEFRTPNITISGDADLIGKSNLYIKNIEFNVSDKRKLFNPVQTEIDPNALEDTAALKNARGRVSTEKEIETYHVIDSLSEENNLDRVLRIFKVLSTGKIPAGKFNVPIDRFIDFNGQEGFRLGAGLETSDKLNKWFTLGGYFAYGFRDKEWKWGGDLSLNFNQRREFFMNFHYSDDLQERGGTTFLNEKFNLIEQSSSVLREFYINRFDRQRKAEISISGLIRQNFKLTGFANYKRFTFTDSYQFEPLGMNRSSFEVAETGVEINWNIREKVMMLGDRRVSLGSKYPNIKFRAVKGFSGIAAADFDYYRLQMSIEQEFSIRGFGKLYLSGKSGITLGDVPLTLSQVELGTGTESFGDLSVPNTFQTMRPAEFFSDRQAALFARFRFLPIKIEAISNFSQPTFVVHSAAGVGSMNNIENHLNYEFNVANKGYYESGLIIDNLLISGFSGFGIGAIYRYGPYSFDQPTDNIVYKISLSFLF